MVVRLLLLAIKLSAGGNMATEKLLCVEGGFYKFGFHTRLSLLLDRIVQS